MDVELCDRLAQHAPRQRRSVGNLLQQLVAEGLDRLDVDERSRELIRNAHELLAYLGPTEIDQALSWQRALLQTLRAGKRVRAERFAHLLPPSWRETLLPPKPAPSARRHKRSRHNAT